MFVANVFDGPTKPYEMQRKRVSRVESAIGERPSRAARMANRFNDIGIVSGTKANGLLHLKNGVDYINPGEEDQMEIYG